MLPNSIDDREYQAFKLDQNGDVAKNVTSADLSQESTQVDILAKLFEVEQTLDQILLKQTNVINETVRDINFIVPFAMSRELRVGPANLENRFSVLLFNKSNDVIYWFEEPTFNAMDAFPIFPNQYYEWQYSDIKSIYVKSASMDLPCILVEGR